MDADGDPGPQSQASDQPWEAGNDATFLSQYFATDCFTYYGNGSTGAYLGRPLVQPEVAERDEV